MLVVASHEGARWPTARNDAAEGTQFLAELQQLRK